MLKSTQNQAIIFDLDGVIINSEPVWQKIERDFFAAHGGVLRGEYLAQLIGKNMLESCEFIRQKLELTCSTSDVAASLRQSILERRHDIELAVGYRELIEKVKQKKWRRAVASAATRDYLQFMADKFNLRADFEFLVSTDEVAYSKPAPDVFLEAARQLDIAPERCVVIEDSVNGVLATKAAGMKCVAIPHPQLVGHTVYKKADIVRAHLTDITITDLQLS